MNGISVRQGPHHVAQKLIKTALPRKSMRLTVSPLVVSKVKSGASAPLTGAVSRLEPTTPAGAPEQAAMGSAKRGSRINLGRSGFICIGVRVACCVGSGKQWDEEIEGAEEIEEDEDGQG